MHTKIGWTCCKECDGTTNEIIMDHGKHYGKLVCAKCNHFKQWIQNPNITRAVEDRAKKIDLMLIKYDSQMTEKVKAFLTKAKTIRFMTPYQFMFLNSLDMKYPLN
jgi:hypothetical protein